MFYILSNDGANIITDIAEELPRNEVVYFVDVSDYKPTAIGERLPKPLTTIRNEFWDGYIAGLTGN